MKRTKKIGMPFFRILDGSGAAEPGAATESQAARQHARHLVTTSMDVARESLFVRHWD